MGILMKYFFLGENLKKEYIVASAIEWKAKVKSYKGRTVDA